MVTKLKLLELTDDKARILFEGEGKTYINALAVELIDDPGVDVAQHRQAFQFSDPELVVTTVGVGPSSRSLTQRNGSLTVLANSSGRSKPSTPRRGEKEG